MAPLEEEQPIDTHLEIISGSINGMTSCHGSDAANCPTTVRRITTNDHQMTALSSSLLDLLEVQETLISRVSTGRGSPSTELESS